MHVHFMHCEIFDVEHWNITLRCNKYDFFPVCILLTNHETLYNLNIVLSFHPPLESINAFLQLLVCDQNT